MADFVARIRAELDTSGVLSQLKNLTSTERTLPIKIEIDTSSLNNAMRNLGGGSGGLVQNFGNLGKQAGSAFADNYFKEQIQLAKRANQLKAQFPDSKKLSKADSFYKSAAKAELTEQKRTQKETQKVLDQQYDYLGKRERQYNTERAKAIAKNQSDIRKMEREQAQETQKALDQQYNYLGKRESEYQTERAKAIAKNQADIRRMEREQAQEASAYSKQFGNGKYSADSAVMDNKLSQYAGQDSEALSRARAAAEEYKTIMDELNQSFDQNKGFNLDDSMVVDKFSKMEDAAEKYKNAMKQVGAESTKSLGRFEAIPPSRRYRVLPTYEEQPARRPALRLVLTLVSILVLIIVSVALILTLVIISIALILRLIIISIALVLALISILILRLIVILTGFPRKWLILLLLMFLLSQHCKTINL